MAPVPTPQDVVEADSYGGLIHLDLPAVTREAADRLLHGYVIVEPFPPALLGQDIDWAANPPQHPSFQAGLHTLKWTLPLLAAYQRWKDPRYAARAAKIYRSWLQSNPLGAAGSEFAWSERPVGYRAKVLARAAEVLGVEPWLREALEMHAWHLASSHGYAGAWNHGLDQDLGLLAVSAVLRDDELFKAAQARAEKSVYTLVSSDGVSREQSVHYHLYNWQQLNDVRAQVEKFGRVLSSEVARRIDAMPNFLAHATAPTGEYVQLGDMFSNPARVIGGTAAEFAATQGLQGPRPASTQRHFERDGYAFGRSGWGDARAFVDESYYALRFGPSREIHGHHDHTSLVYYAFGQQVITEGGFGGYERDGYLGWLRGPSAHNVVVAANAGPKQWANPATELTRCEVAGSIHLYELRDRPYRDVLRTRQVRFDLAANEIQVEDTVSGPKSRLYFQLWHLPPEMTAVVTGSSVEATDGRVEVRVEQHLPVELVEVKVGATEPFQGWVSHRLRHRAPAPTVVSAARGRVATWQTTISITRPDQPAPRWLAPGCARA